MGIYDRPYYRDNAPMTFGFGQSGRSAVTTLIILNCVLYFLDALGPNGGGWLVQMLGLESDVWRQPWNVWQLVTYGFMHSPLNQVPGIWHLFFNMLGLFIFGLPVEQKYGKAEFLRMYVIAIAFSGAVWLVYASFQGSPATLIGASGAVSAVVILMALNFPFREVLLFGILPMKIWLLATIFVAMDLLGSFRGSEGGIAYQAHLGGALFAALYFFLRWNFAFLAKFQLPRRRPRLRVHRPSPDQRLQIDADRVLDKLHQSGEESLTRAERRTLERYSEQMRQRRQQKDD